MISVAILTKNNETTIADTLRSVATFDEVLLLDTGSSDTTLQIASSFANTRIMKTDFTGFGQLRNLAASYAKNDWILALDSDEKLSMGLQKELKELVPIKEKVYRLPFHNYYNGRHIKWCGWHPEWHIRLYNRKTTSFDSALVHEGIKTENLNIQTLKHPVIHTPYRSAEDFLRKMQIYSSLFACQNNEMKTTFSKAFTHGLFAFVKSYFLKRGFLGGKEGFIISVYNGNTVFYKYLKLLEK